MKMFNTNCRIQLQHIGKSNYSPQLYLANRSPPKYFAEEILLPLCQSINNTVSKDTEREFVIHLKTEIQRLKKGSKDVEKNKKVTCINPNCKNSNHLNANNVDSYAICVNCQSYEHYRRAKVDSPLKGSYQDGSVKYFCTKCLLEYPCIAMDFTVVDQPKAITYEEKELDSNVVANPVVEDGCVGGDRADMIDTV